MLHHCLLIFILLCSSVRGEIKVACEEELLTLSCPPGRGLAVQEALYGRKGSDVCPDNQILTTDCSARDALSTLRSRCDGKTSCEVASSNTEFGDPCQGTSKYLQVTYQCLRREESFEGKTVDISCPSGQVLDVYTAFYGSDASTKAALRIQPRHAETTCSSEEAADIVALKCDNKPRCRIKADESIFGDPCSGESKSFHVLYNCTKKGDIVNTCEHKWLKLQCPWGFKIRIISASYGRSDLEVCPGKGFDIDCHSDFSEMVVTLKCNNRQSCAVKASSHVFGNPCQGTYKYLYVLYDCVEGSSGMFNLGIEDFSVREELTRQIACQGEPLTVQCQEGEFIDVLTANYGRTDRFTCTPEVEDTSPCESEDSLEIVKERCQGEQNCTVDTDNSLFGNPCTNTSEYLEVVSRCISSHLAVKRSVVNEALKNTACEHESMSLSCDRGKTLTIVNANYGRTDRSICQRGPIKTTQCFSQQSLDIVSQRCNNKQNCVIPAVNSIFGDPCGGTFKYLEVAYKCKGPSDPQLSSTGNGKKNTVCEHEPMSLSCETGKVLHIVQANYGRTDGITCQKGPIQTSQCSSQNSLAIVSERCNSKQECTIAASNSVFGDPCVGTFKYLDIVYECKDSPNPPTTIEGHGKKNTVCEHESMILSCDAGKVVHIVQANYGRTDGTTCKKGPIQTSQCSSQKSLTIASERCNNKTSCAIQASNSLFGDPCVGTFKYLDIDYECKESAIPPLTTGGNGKKNTVCEHEPMSLSCETGKVLHIVQANYGRTDGITCQKGPIQTSQCSSQNTLAIVSERCNSKQECTIAASNSVFGDPCVGTFKYLDIVYECKDSPNPPTTIEGHGKKNTVCEHESMILSCDAGKVVHIVQANYGRTDGTTCKKGPIQTSQCSSQKSLTIASERCNNKTSCAIQASNSLFGDPCVGTFKYLDIDYECKESAIPPLTTGGNGKKNTVCEHEPMSLSCETGKVLHIVQANYGRTDGITCQKGPIQTSQCSSQNSLAIVSERCNSKQECTIAASNSVFGDPCVGTFKYLDIVYECKDSPNPPTTIEGHGKKNTVCEHESMILSCDAGKVVHIVQANYGRTDGTTCKKGPIQTSQCSSQKSLTIASERCNNKTSCAIQASNSLFGDPCVGTFKYLDIDYECKESAIPPLTTGGNGKKNTVCEHEPMSLSCETGKVLHIVQANYGRTDGITCQKGPIQTSQCSSQNSLAIVSERCNSKQECTIAASNSVFGDPCVGTFKYLDIVYECKDSPNPPTTIEGHGKKNTVCEHESMILSCDAGKVVHIVQANYGRTDGTTCKKGPIQTSQCSSQKSLTIASERCNNKTSCAIQASNSLFGDPCVGTFKYLDIDYECKESAIPPLTTGGNGKKNTVCEHEPMSLSCETGKVLHIVQANYGRTDGITCQKGPIQTSQCSSQNSLAIVSERCNSKQECTIAASNSVFGDPCVGTFKYLDIVYECKDSPNPPTTIEGHGKKNTVCEHESMILSCDAGKVVHIVQANYGRTDGTTCKKGPIQTSQCSSQKSLTIASERCNNKTSCAIQASNSLFGDPCVGTFKYLDIDYECKESAIPPLTTGGNGKKNTVCEHEPMSLSCETGKVLHIVQANYGRTDGITCQKGPIQTSQCSSQNTLAIVSERCNSKQECTIAASNSVFGDPCVGTFKYLDIVYECKDSPNSPTTIEGHGKKNTVCEHESMILSCDAGKVVHIVQANYGRTDGTTCKKGPIQTSQCSSQKSLTIASERCNNKTSCAIQASNSLFGDPCVGTFKYLDIDYECKESAIPPLTTGGNGKKNTVCEHEPMSLSCETGKVLHIVQANYGRTDGITCQKGPIQTSQCSSQNTLAIVSERCNSKQECTIAASNSVFGDPCVGTFKYLDIVYECKDSPNPPTTIEGHGKKNTVCEHESMILSCDAGKVVHIVQANYGRTDGTTCKKGPIQTSQCSSQKSLTIASERCNNKTSCAIQASNSLFGDPCVGTFKYLDIDYECKESAIPPLTTGGNGKKNTVCEHEPMSLSCETGKVLHIVQANYGRTDGITCQKGPIQTSQCSSQNTLAIVSERCNSKQECTIAASNSVFGDPCVGTFKYLDIVYECKDSPNSPTTIEGHGKKNTVCEHESMILSCDAGKVVHIVQANYGRTDGTTCKKGPIQTSQCSSQKSLTIASERCNNKTSCAIQASNSLFGDPCVGTFKYLDIDYECKESAIPPLTTGGNGKKNTVCEHEPMSLSCETGKVLHIVQANYGRTDGITCQKGPIQTSQCSSQNTLAIVSERCNSKQECTIAASNSVFGDPCVGTFKYLDIVYECKDSPNPPTTIEGHGKKNTVCEHESMILSCDAGKVVHIVQANYGRTDGTTCKKGPIQTSQCSSQKSLTIASERCNNKTSCAIEARNSVFGDPCVGTFKYLDIEYECWASSDPLITLKGSGNETKNTVCENESMVLSCDERKLLKIIHANYGRMDGSICTKGPILTTECSSQNTLDTVTKWCNAKQGCTISASNSVFGDPCEGTFKYLDIVYECEDSFNATSTTRGNVKNSVVCENESVSLSCNGGKALYIVSANYGRTDETVCQNGPILTTQCFSKNSLHVASMRCDNKTSCTIEATDAVFGDPCTDTFKYLDIVYECNELHIPEVPTEGDRTKYTVCENDSVTLNCAESESINIVRVNYGRTDETICQTGPILTTDCSSPKALEIVSNMCNSKQHCTIQADNSTFSDPCTGTSKYLDIVYECKESNQVEITTGGTDVVTKGSELKSTVCQENWIKMYCDKGKTLKILSANYGRTDDTICKLGPIQTTHCFSKNSLSIVSERCDNKQNCSIQAANWVFGDPCVGTFKHLDIIYECKDLSSIQELPVGEVTKEETVCEGDILGLNCPNNSLLYITRANYGRTDEKTCKNGPIQTTSCFGEQSINIVREICEGKHSCSIKVVNDLFGDPCFNTFKYLQVTYMCKVGWNKKKSTVCEHRPMNLTCERGKSLHIVSANYGRTDKTTCQGGPIKTTECIGNNSLHVVSQRCQNKESCTIEAESAVFGDPCVDTFKYLDVVYECVESIQILDVEIIDVKPLPVITPSSSESIEAHNVITYPTASSTIPLFTIGNKKKSTVCEHISMNLTCEEGKSLHIVSANYGRTDKTTCQGGPIKTTECIGNNSLHIVSQRCQSKESCTIEAESAVFGDPCVDTFKYLDVIYECVESVIILDVKPLPVMALWGIECEGGVLTLDCSSDDRLHILKANYGRRDNLNCPLGPKLTTSCASKKSLHVVKNECEGKVSCRVEASERLFGDPCPGTSKVLEVTYICNSGPVWGSSKSSEAYEPQSKTPASVGVHEPVAWPSSSESIETHYVPTYTTAPPLVYLHDMASHVILCEGSWVALKCGVGLVLRVTYANYGRTSGEVCHVGPIQTTSCIGENTIDVVKERCEGNRDCNLKASSELFGEPCENTYKYLEINYTCQRDEPPKKVLNLTVCEGERKSIACGESEGLHITDANYGRTDGTTCNKGPIKSVDCKGEGTLDIVKTLCEGESKCSIAAETEIFGDPCFNTFKYLAVEYTCLKVDLTDLDVRWSEP